MLAAVASPDGTSTLTVNAGAEAITPAAAGTSLAAVAKEVYQSAGAVSYTHLTLPTIYSV